MDATLPPENWKPSAILDRLAEIFNRSKTAYDVERKAKAKDFEMSESRTLSRKPLLGNLRLGYVESIGELETFFSRVSLATYEALYTGTHVNWDQIEVDLKVDLFDG